MADTDLRELQRQAETGDEEARKRLYRSKRRSGVLPAWDELKAHFADIIFDAEGPTKSKSGGIHIDMVERVHLRLGTYDIGDWPSWTNLGPFDTMEEAQRACADKLDEAEEEVRRDKEEDYVDNKENTKACPDCGSILGCCEYPPIHDITWCKYCQYTFHACDICGKVYSEEADAGDCCF